jgi:hypothetical protein
MLIADNHSKDSQIQYLKEQCNYANNQSRIDSINVSMRRSQISEQNQLSSNILSSIYSKMEEKEGPAITELKNRKLELKKQVLDLSSKLLKKEMELNNRESMLQKQEKLAELKKYSAHTVISHKENVAPTKKSMSPFKKLVNRLSRASLA